MCTSLSCLLPWIALIALATSTSQAQDQGLSELNKMRTTSPLPVSHSGDCYDFSEGDEQLRTFKTPNYPNNYPPKSKCIRVIRAPVGFAVQLSFIGSFFEVEPPYIQNEEQTMECNKSDYIEIRDGKYGFSRLIGRYCGLKFPNGIIRALSGSMWLHFNSDGLLQYRGFKAQYSFVRLKSVPQNLPIDCHFSPPSHDDGIMKTDIMKTFYKYYSNGSQSIDCVWEIRAETGMQMRLFINHFVLGAPNQCHKNFMEVYAGTTSGPPMKRYCGMNAGNVRTGWNTAFIRVFSTVEALPDLSISALYTAYTISKNCSELGLFACGDDTCIPESLVCNNRLDCLYEKDEENCVVDEAHSPIKLTGTYLIILVSICSLILSLVLCALVLNCCPACRRRQQKYDELLREIARSPEHSRNAFALDRRRHTVPAFQPEHDPGGLAMLSSTTGDLTVRSPHPDEAFHHASTVPAHLQNQELAHRDNVLRQRVGTHQSPYSATSRSASNLRFQAQHSNIPYSDQDTEESSLHPYTHGKHYDHLNRRQLQQHTPMVHNPRRPAADSPSSTITSSGLNPALAGSSRCTQPQPPAERLHRPKLTELRQQHQLMNGMLPSGATPHPPNTAKFSLSQSSAGSGTDSPQRSRRMVTFVSYEADEPTPAAEHERRSILTGGHSQQRHSRSEPFSLSSAYQDELAEEMQELEVRRSPLWQPKPRTAHQSRYQDYPQSTESTLSRSAHSALASSAAAEARSRSAARAAPAMSMSPSTSPVTPSPDGRTREYVTSIVTRI